MSKKITITEISRLANVSKTTVSRVINNKPDVLPETRERIQAIIKEHDFYPNAYAKAISHQRSNTVGLLIPYSSDYIFSNPYYYEVIRGIALELNHSGYYLMFVYSHGNNYQTVLKQNRVDGLILLSPGKGHEDVVNTIRSMEIPVVATSKMQEVPDIHYIDTNNIYGATLAVEHLTDLGHRRIGFINGPDILASSQDRFTGYVNALKNRGIPYDPSLVKLGDTTISSGYNAMTELMNENDLSAVFVASDLMAIGVFGAISNMGKSVPGDISVVGFDDIPLAGELNPPLTTIRQCAYDKGVHAAKMLSNLLNGKNIPKRKNIKVELVKRGSTGKLER